MAIYWLYLFGLSLLLFAGMLGCFELGFRWGGRRASRDPDAATSGTGVIDAAVFALLGLLLAFQFGGAANRLDNRRQIAISELNSISTAYDRLDMLAAEDQEPLRDLFRRYLDHRVLGREAMPDLETAKVEFGKVRKLYNEIWIRAVAACRNKNALPATSEVLLPAINQMGDDSMSGATLALTHIPVFINVFTFILALIAAMLAGAPASAKERRPWVHVILLAAAVSITYFVILDMEYPRVGFIRIGIVDQHIAALRQAME